MQSKTVTYSSRPEPIKEAIQRLWKYRSLVWIFAKRDIKVKYAQTHLGIYWGVFKPLLSLFIYVFFFGYILSWSTGDTPYPVYVFTGLIGWNLFSYVVNSGVSSVHESTDLINKVYFPKAILPLSKMIVGIVEAIISLLLIIPLMLYYQIFLSWKIIFIPVALLFNVMCGLSITFVISAFSIMKKDLLQVLPFLLHMAIWLTPVFFEPTIFPEKVRIIFSLNPIANIIDTWRWVLLDEVKFNVIWIANFFVISALLFVSFYFFTRRENKFVDFN